MSASVVTSRTAEAEHVTLGALLGERNILLLFVLGIGTGIPFGYYWFDIFPRIDQRIDRTLYLALIGFGAIGVLQLLVAPFLDRYRAPLFAGLGHRRSWVAATLAIALALIVLSELARETSPGAVLRYGALSGVLALPALALLWIALDALRIELYRGRAQAVAYAAQFMGALTSTALVARFGAEMNRLLILLLALLLALAIGAVLLIREPPRADRGVVSNTLLATLTRPWRTFFARHGKAAGLLLGAIASYALAASTRDYLGRHGYVADILGRLNLEPEIDYGAIDNARGVVATQEMLLLAIGALAGLLIAFRMAPARALVALIWATLGVIVLFIVCKAALGFTVFTVAGLFAAQSIVSGAAHVIFATVVGRLTAPPDTAGHVILLGLFAGVFWISDSGFTLLIPLMGTYAMAAGAAVAAAISILLTRLAALRAKRAGD